MPQVALTQIDDSASVSPQMCIITVMALVATTMKFLEDELSLVRHTLLCPLPQTTPDQRVPLSQSVHELMKDLRDRFLHVLSVGSLRNTWRYGPEALSLVEEGRELAVALPRKVIQPILFAESHSTDRESLNKICEQIDENLKELIHSATSIRARSIHVADMVLRSATSEHVVRPIVRCP